MPTVATAGDRHTGEGAAASGCFLARDPAEDIFVRHQVEEGPYLDRRVIAHAEDPDVVVVIRLAVQGDQRSGSRLIGGSPR